MSTEKFRQFFFHRIDIGRTLRESFDFVSGLVGFDNSGDAEKSRIRFAMNSLVHHILLLDGRISRERCDICRRIWEERLSHADAADRLQELISLQPAEQNEAVAILESIAPNQKESIMEFLMALEVALGDDADKKEMIFDVGRKLGVEKEFMETGYHRLQEEARKRKLLLSSGWGVVVAIGVILLFIITAKLLQSVIFGLILGCVLLPLEKFIERQLRRRSGLFFWLVSGVEMLFKPLQKLQGVLTRKDKELQIDESKVADNRIIRKSVSMTAVAALILVSGVILGISSLTGHYMRDWRKRVHQESSEYSRQGYVKKINDQLEVWREKFEKLPPVRKGLDLAERMVNDPETRAKLAEELIRRSGGVMKVVADIFGAVTAFFTNLLLTVFFGLLFLFKLAQFCRDDDSDKSKSEYVIRMIFNGIWLPGAEESVIAEARRIIEGVFFRLRVWMKGYLTLVLVDSSVYTAIFFFMGLPFFWALGIIAGCGILLPYLGPVISCVITVGVTWALGGASGSLLLGIVIAYLIYNGIVEQFILYPAVIGEALGLSTLETIIVVLLGAIFAGIPGMIFALPAASVAKYIIPQLYRNFIRPVPVVEKEVS